MPQGSEFQNFWTSFFRSGMDRALATWVNLGWMLARDLTDFAFFAEFLCALCGQKLLTAKAAKDSAKDAKQQSSSPCFHVRCLTTFTTMQKLEEPRQVDAGARVAILPVSVIVPVRNEAHNLPRCLESLRGVGEVYVVDSQSSDETAEIARSFGAKVIQFHYRGRLAQEAAVGDGYASPCL